MREMSLFATYHLSHFSQHKVYKVFSTVVVTYKFHLYSIIAIKHKIYKYFV